MWWVLPVLVGYYLKALKTFRLFSKFCDSEKYEVVFFENMWQWKMEGCLLADFAAYHSERTLFLRIFGSNNKKVPN